MHSFVARPGAMPTLEQRVCNSMTDLLSRWLLATWCSKSVSLSRPTVCSVRSASTMHSFLARPGGMPTLEQRVCNSTTDPLSRLVLATWCSKSFSSTLSRPAVVSVAVGSVAVVAWVVSVAVVAVVSVAVVGLGCVAVVALRKQTPQAQPRRKMQTATLAYMQNMKR